MIDRACVDLDGTLVNFQKSAALLHGINLDDLISSGQDVVDFCKMPPDEFYAPMGKDFWASLDWTDDGRAIMDLVERFFHPRNICILTAPINTVGCSDGKKVWIKRHLPAYRRQYLIGPAKDFCANPSTVHFDDRDTIVQEFRERGHAILVPRSWNKSTGRPVIETIEAELKVLLAGA